jgi:ferritin-like metal-binding protein YciE
MQKTMKDLFIDELHDVLSAEEQIVKAMPKVIEAAESKDLKEAFRSHLQETKEQVKRLGKVFKLLKEKRKPKFCKGTKGLIDECNETIKEYKKSPVRDAALISKTQRIEHYEISAYGTICTFARELGHSAIAVILHKTLNEEEAADKKLTKIAEGNFFSCGINHEANLPKPAKKQAKKSSFSGIMEKIGEKIITSSKPSKKRTAKSTSTKKTAVKKTAGKKFSITRKITSRSNAKTKQRIHGF